MTLPPTKNTEQEIIIAEYLSELGFRYTQQEFFPPYKVDFYIEEINTAIEEMGFMDIYLKEIKLGIKF